MSLTTRCTTTLYPNVHSAPSRTLNNHGFRCESVFGLLIRLNCLEEHCGYLPNIADPQATGTDPFLA
jgi:hypothetical protein